MDPPKPYLRKSYVKRANRGTPIELPTIKGDGVNNTPTTEERTEGLRSDKQRVVVRIKRRRGDLPVENLVVDDIANLNKRKAPKIFHLVNTIESEKDPKAMQETNQVTKLRANIVKALPKRASNPMLKATPFLVSLDDAENLQKLRERKVAEIIKVREDSSRSARFKIVSKRRLMPATDEEESDCDTNHPPIALYDAVQNTDTDQGDNSEITCNLQRLLRQKLTFNLALEDFAQDDPQDDYVYDLYELDEDEVSHNSRLDAAALSWVDFSDPEAELMASSTQSGMSSEDSNTEDYFANDYPDEEESSEEYNSYAYDSDQDSDGGFSY